MVLPGQYLERSLVVGELDALYHRGRRDPPCAIASPHPAVGGSMVSPVIAELAWALTRAGHATLRFNYRGVGSSRGVSRHPAGSMKIGDVVDEVADLYEIIDQLLATNHAGTACAIGYSFGAKVALEAAQDPRISQVVLVAPPNKLADFSALDSLRKPLFVLCAHHDTWCDRSALRLPGGAQLEVIPHSDHFFGRGLTEMGKAVATFLRGERSEFVAPLDAPEEVEPEHVELELPEGDEEPLELETDPK